MLKTAAILIVVIFLLAIHRDGFALMFIGAVWVVKFFAGGRYRGGPFLIPHSWLWLLAIAIMTFALNRERLGL